MINETMEGIPTVNVIDERQQADLDKRFTYHSPKGDQPERYNVLRATAKRMAETIVMLAPDSRERSLALTKLEEACFWANASIARNE